MLTKPGSSWQVSIPFQAITPHKGGQLDTNSSPVYTVINTATGIKATWNNPDKKNFIKEFKTSIYRTWYHSSDDKKVYPFDKGNGTLLNFYLRSKWNFALLSSWWKGENFVAPRGSKIFQSVSSMPGNSYTEKNRDLLFLNVIYEKELIPGFNIDCRFSPYVNLDNGSWEYAWLMLFTYKKNFRLLKIKPGH